MGTTTHARNADVTLEYAGWVLKTDVDLMSVQSLLTGKSISVDGLTNQCLVSRITPDSASTSSMGSRIECSNIEKAVNAVDGSKLVKVEVPARPSRTHAATAVFVTRNQAFANA